MTKPVAYERISDKDQDVETLEIKEVKKSEFGSKFRDAVFPIHNHELVKFLSMSFMLFCVIFVYTLVRNTKDTLIISNSGAETVTFLKVYGVLPAATLFLVFYAKISSKLSKRNVFYVTCVPFIVWYAAFAYILYPMVNAGLLHPHKFCDKLQEKMGDNWKYLIDCLRFWTFSVFYIMSELWGSVGVSVLFWQFANDIIPLTSAKRFYPLFGQLANLAPIASGMCVVYFNFHPKDDSEEAKNKAFEKSIQFLTIPVIACGLGVIILFRFVSNIVEREENTAAAEKGLDTKPKPKKKKPSMGLGESFKFLIRQKYLGLICVLVVAYGLSINLTEVIWKSQVKKQYPNKYDYQRFMGMYSSISGATTFMIIFAGSNVVKRLGWLIGALTTPVLMMALSVPFFLFIIFIDLDKSPDILFLSVVLGTIANILSKSCKYSMFDPTKEMAYIPLDEESKSKGKAAIDVLASRIGKSGGALFQQGVVVGFGSIVAGAPIVATMFVITVGGWIASVFALGRLFAEKTAQLERNDIHTPLLEVKATGPKDQEK